MRYDDKTDERSDFSSDSLKCNRSAGQVIRNGEIRSASLVRTRRKGIDRLREFIRSASHIEDLAIVYSTTPDDAQALADYVCSLFPNVVPRIARLGAALGVYGGPGALIAVLREAK